MSSLNPTVSAMIYQRTPKEMLSRMGGIITAVAFGGAPLGGVFAGFLVQYLGLTNAILVATGLYFTVTLTPVVGRRLWRRSHPALGDQPWSQSSRQASSLSRVISASMFARAAPSCAFISSVRKIGRDLKADMNASRPSTNCWRVATVWCSRQTSAA